MYADLYASLVSTTWAIYEPMLQYMARLAMSNEPALSAYDLAAEARTPRKLPKVAGNVAVLPLYGMIQQRGSIWQELFGGTATQQFAAAYQRAIADPKVGGVVIDVDSPGGSTAGVMELADVIWRGAQQKPVAAIANSQMASAAYWLSSQVGPGQKRLVATPGADVGSIGVFRMHEDISQQLAADGVKVTFISTPRYKTEANPFEPLSADALEHHQEQVDATYSQFVDAVARGRGVRGSLVRSNFGEGRMFHAQQAAEKGLVDRVATLEQVVGEFGAQPALTAAESHVLQEELCHAWECGGAIVHVEFREQAAYHVLEHSRKRFEVLRKMG